MEEKDGGQALYFHKENNNSREKVQCKCITEVKLIRYTSDETKERVKRLE